MKNIISAILFVMLASMAWGAPVNTLSTFATKQNRPAKNIGNSNQKGVNPVNNSPKKSSSPLSNIIPITTLNYKKANDQGVPQYEPCTATRLTSNLLFTAAHCLVGGLTHGSRIQVELLTTEDGKEGLFLSKPREDSLFQTNAQVFVYKPQYTQPGDLIPPFDFGVVVLDKTVKFNPKSVKKMLKQTSMMPLFGNQMEALIQQKAQQKFVQKSMEYTKFLNRKLEEVSLLVMRPEGVEEELQGRKLYAYRWGGEQYDPVRYPLETWTLTGKGTGAPQDSHTMLFSGAEFQGGISGSPIFDTERKFVISLAIGVVGGLDAGGLIEQAVCDWVRQYDSNVACVVRHDGVVANEQEG